MVRNIENKSLNSIFLQSFFNVFLMGPFPKQQPSFILLYQFKLPKLPLGCLQLWDTLVGHLKFGLQCCRRIIQLFQFQTQHSLQRSLKEQQPRRHKPVIQHHLDMIDGRRHRICHDQNGEWLLFWFWCFIEVLKSILWALQRHLMNLYLLGRHWGKIVIGVIFQLLTFWLDHHLIRYWLEFK